MKQKTQDEKWLYDLRDQLADYKADLPADSWEHISAKLKQQRPSAMKLSSRHRAIRWAAILLLLLGSSVTLYLMTISHKEQTFSEQVHHKVEDKGIAKDSTLPAIADKRTKLAFVTKKTSHQESSNTVGHHAGQGINEDTAHVATEANPTEENVAKEERTVQDQYKPWQKPIVASSDAVPHKKSHHQWKVGIGMSGNGSLSSASTDAAAAGPWSDPQQGNITLPGSEEKSRHDDVIGSSNHHSVSFGLMLSRELSPRLAFETGIVYTNLSSDVTMRYAGRQEQYLHYLGVPLKLKLALWQQNKFSIYAGGGVMPEYCLSATRDGREISDNDKWQLSAGASMGIQYEFVPHTSFYIEPGLNYYFKPDKEVPTIRTEHPCMLNLQIGVRLGM